MSKRVLVVDDDRAATGVLSRLLTKLGYEVREENNAVKAVEAAREFQPGVVILDFLMPEVHGGEIAWQLAQDPALEKTPGLILCSGVPIAYLEQKLPPVRINVIEKPVDFGALVVALYEARAA